MCWLLGLKAAAVQGCDSVCCQWLKNTGSQIPCFTCICCRSREVFHHAGTCLENNGIRRSGESGTYFMQRKKQRRGVCWLNRGSLALTQLCDLFCFRSFSYYTLICPSLLTTPPLSSPLTFLAHIFSTSCTSFTCSSSHYLYFFLSFTVLGSSILKTNPNSILSSFSPKSLNCSYRIKGGLNFLNFA